MKPKPKMLLAGLIMLAALCCGQQAMAQTLVLHHADGTTTDVELYTMPQVTFQNDKVLITSTVLNMEYPKENVLRFTYKGGTATSVGKLKPNADYTQKNDQIVFHGIKSADKVAVYSANGIRVPVRLVRCGSDVTLSLSSIPSGVYLLNVNGKTSKFTKP